MNITIDSNSYNIHVVNNRNYNFYKNILDNAYICDDNFVKKSYENLAYSALEYDGYLGFFLTDVNNSILYLSAILDFNCSQIQSKLSDVNNINLEKAVELTILCSNTKERIYGLASKFLTIMLSDYIPSYKPDVEYVLLYVAQGLSNKKALSFYIKMGFREILPNIMEYVYTSHQGGKKRKYTNKNRKNKNRKNKNTKKYYKPRNTNKKITRKYS